MTAIFERVGDLAPHIGKSLGTSDWVTVTQQDIDAFAALTGDSQWIHTDVERAKKEMPGGKTLAHGYLVLSLMPRMAIPLWRIEKKKHALNYGLNKLRFTAPVPSGSRIRLTVIPKSLEPIENNGTRLVMENIFELEGSKKPAIVAEVLLAYFD